MGLFSRSKKFTEPLTTNVYSSSQVILEKQPIHFVFHELNGEWFFMGMDKISNYEEVKQSVPLKTIIAYDKSVLEIADLQPGYQAWRGKRGDKWIVSAIEYPAETTPPSGYYCSSCGEYHSNIPMNYGFDAPLYYYLIPEEERATRCELTKSQCIIDEKYFFIRGHVQLKVENNPNSFHWSIWASISESDFNNVCENWDDENRILQPAYTGELANDLEPYPVTRGLMVNIITRPVGMIPIFQLQPSDHPLYLEQEADNHGSGDQLCEATIARRAIENKKIKELLHANQPYVLVVR